MVDLTSRRRRRSHRPADVAAWLRTGPSLREMREAFPEEWEHVETHVAALVSTGEDSALRAYLTQSAQVNSPRRGHDRPHKEIVAEAVHRQMTLEAVRQAAARAETGVTGDKLRLGLVNGWLLQRLLFEQGLRRKEVSWIAFRILWPVLSQHRRLMALVRPHGIYCFHARPLLSGLARLVAGRPCLEVAAGDGTLARLLTDRGLDVTATDDHSWDSQITYDPSVIRESATTSLRTRRPRVVLCCWPPPDNTFERRVFTTASVETYIVITPHDEASGGDWAAYRSQKTFTMSEHTSLARYVIPHGGRVLVFQRNPTP